MEKVFVGYARTSTRSQKLESQILTLEKMGCVIENIYTDKFTGKGDIYNREGWVQLRKDLNSKKRFKGKKVVICFMSINRMSRNKETGTQEYFALVNEGYELKFQMEPHLDSEVYGDKIKATSDITVEDDDMNNTIMKGIRDYMVLLAKKQIEIAFEQSQKEAEHIREKVIRGLKNSKKVSGRKKGYISTKKKNVPRDFEEKAERMKVTELARYFNVTRPTIYSWKKEISK